MSVARIEIVTCAKCGKKFQVTKGGFFPQPVELMPICPECKFKTIKDIFK